MKYYLYALLLIGVFVACKNDAPEKKVKNVDATVLDGKTMGTYYRVTYLSDEPFDLQGSIDSLLKVISDVIRNSGQSCWASRSRPTASAAGTTNSIAATIINVDTTLMIGSRMLRSAIHANTGIVRVSGPDKNSAITNS